MKGHALLSNASGRGTRRDLVDVCQVSLQGVMLEERVRYPCVLFDVDLLVSVRMLESSGARLSQVSITRKPENSATRLSQISRTRQPE